MAWRSALLREVDEACDHARDLIARHFAPIEARVRAHPERRLEEPLHDQQVALDLGTKPLSILHDDENRTYVLKQGEAALLAAEECAWELRQLGARAGVPAVRARVVVDDAEREGLLKPYIDLQGGELTAQTDTWTVLQRAVVLREHAWEHVLENIDTNTTQYALIGPTSVPVNIDWDRAFAADPGDVMSRFLKYRPVLPNARTFLYADYVEGRVDLPLELLAREAHRIRRLPTGEVRAILTRYARVRFPDDEGAAHELVERVIRKKQRVTLTVARFIRDLRRERSRILRPTSFAARVERWWKRRWDQWQVILHVVGRGPLGTFGRKTLKLVRGRRLRSPTGPPLIPPPVT
jgi:hypothetical protein